MCMCLHSGPQFRSFDDLFHMPCCDTMRLILFKPFTLFNLSFFACVFFFSYSFSFRRYFIMHTLHFYFIFSVFFFRDVSNFSSCHNASCVRCALCLILILRLILSGFSENCPHCNETPSATHLDSIPAECTQ